MNRYRKGNAESREEAIVRIICGGGVLPKTARSVTEGILSVVGSWANSSTRKSYLNQLRQFLSCVKLEKRIDALTKILAECGLPDLTGEEIARFQGHASLIAFNFKAAKQVVLDGLSNPQTRWLVVMVLVIALAFVIPRVEGVFQKMGFVAASFASRSSNVAAEMGGSTPLSPDSKTGFESIPAQPANNKPTATPNPTPTPVPKPIPKALLPKGAEGGYMGVAPIPDGERKLLSEGVAVLAGFAFGNRGITGAITLWRSFVDRYEGKGLLPGSSAFSEYEERAEFYKCQCSTPLTADCRKVTNVPAESGSWYDWFITLAPLYNLREDEQEYVAEALTLCALANQAVSLWPIPANSAEYSRWIMARRDSETQRFLADVLISAPELSQFRELWGLAGLNPETDDPFGEIIVHIAGGEEFTPLPDASAPKEIKVPELENAPVKEEPTPEPRKGTSAEEPSGIGAVIEAFRAKVQRGVFRVGVSSNNSGGMFLGTGFYVGKAGKIYIVTNYHVVSSGCPCFIVDKNGGKRELNLLTYEGSNRLDMAVFEPSGWDVSANDYVFKLGTDPIEGQLVWSTGYPGGSADSFVFNSGDVIAVGVSLGKAPVTVNGVIVTNAQGDYGSSGSPLLDGNLNVVGIYSGAASHDSGATWEGRGYAFPVSRIDALLSSIVE